MKRWGGVCLLLLIAAAAFAFRGSDLSLRPLHNDEAINAVKLRQLWTAGDYRYDPHEYHGPSLYFFSLPVLAIASSFEAEQPSETSMRLVAVLFGVGLILLTILVADAFGWPALCFAAALTALSPAMVYYSRYFIHEMALVFFTLLFLAGAWRYFQSPRMGWAVLTGIGLGLMFATKETFVFAVFAALVAAVMTIAAEPASAIAPTAEGGGASGQDIESPRAGMWARFKAIPQAVNWRHLAAAVAAALVVAVLFFTSFFTHPGGFLDAFRTYFIWAARAGGESPHVQPWYFFFQRLFWFRYMDGPFWSELPMLVLAAAGGYAVWWKGSRVDARLRRAGRFASVYAVVLAAIYSVIPYKTPWCLLGFYQSLILLAGVGAWRLVAGSVSIVWRLAGTAAVLVAAGYLGWQAWRASFELPADFRNPYVYGHTAQDIVNLLELVDELVRVAEQGNELAMQVIIPGHEYWPLPWYWRHLQRVGWWDQLPENPFAPIVVVGTRVGADLEEKSDQAWLQAGMFEMRPRSFVEVYVERGLWERFLEARRAARNRRD